MHIREMQEYKGAGTVMMYAALPDEVELALLIDDAKATGKKVVLPRMEGNQIEAVLYDGQLMKNEIGIAEPVEGSIVPKEEIDIVIVPGRAFDKKGNRLGRGGGYYDTFLQGYEGMTIGVAFESQIFNELPVDEHDYPVNIIITERRRYDGS